MKKISFLFTLFLFSALSNAQNINFTGSWTLNTELSKLNQEFSLAPSEIIMAHSDNDLRIERHANYQGTDFTTIDSLTLDGKECVNKGYQDIEKKSTAAWSEDKTSLKIISKLTLEDGTDVSITEVYKLDGKNLFIESAATSSYGDLAETMVFDKKQVK